MAVKFGKRELLVTVVLILIISLVGFNYGKGGNSDHKVEYMRQASQMSQDPDAEPDQDFEEMDPPKSPQSSAFQGHLKESRIRLSREHNALKMQYGQLNCQMLASKPKSRYVVAESGGWCYNESKASSRSHKIDGRFAKALAQFLKGKRVASFGDGPGLYKKHVDKTGLVLTYDAYDGAPFCETTTEGLVKFLDLTSPQYGLPLYDWVVTLEVAEHIPAKFESVYMDNVIRHAKEGVIISWAKPGQGGLFHVNEKSFEDVRDLMSDLGFDLDEEAGKGLRGKASLWWFKKNVNVFRRKASNPVNPEDV